MGDWEPSWACSESMGLTARFKPDDCPRWNERPGDSHRPRVHAVRKAERIFASQGHGQDWCDRPSRRAGFTSNTPLRSGPRALAW